MNRSACVTSVAAFIALASLVAAQSPPAPSAIFDDPTLAAGATDVKITAGFEGSLHDVGVARRTASHYTITSTQKNNTGGFYLLIRLEGVKDRTVQLDFEGSPFDKWGGSVPMFSYAADLSAGDGFAADAEDDPAAAARPAAGESPELPATIDQSWHYLADAKHDGPRISVRQRFEQDAAFVAFKIPYLPGQNAAWLKSLDGDARVKVETIGTSRGGRPLQVVTIAQPPAVPARPCALLYAREAPDDQDGSWIAQGAIKSLIADAPEAAALRDACDFVIVPMLDPDGVAAADHFNMAYTFTPAAASPESTAYVAWFKAWRAGGHRCDVAISLYSSPPGSNFHMACPLMEEEPARLAFCESLHRVVRDRLMAQGYAVRNTPWQKGTRRPLLSGWLQAECGTLVLPYVANSLQAKSQLNLAQLRQIGATLASSGGAFLASDAGRSLMADADARRAAAATRPTGARLTTAPARD